VQKYFDGVMAIGVFLGTAIALTSVTIFGMPSWADSQLGSALVGALLGGLLAIVAQALTLAHQDDVARLFRKEAEIALANSTMIKLIEMHSNLMHVKKHLDESLALAAKGPKGPPLCSFVRPLSSKIRHVFLSEPEKSLMIRWCEFDLFNNIISMDWLYSAMSDNLEAYRLDRDALFARFGAVNISGIVGTIEMDRGQHEWFAPRAAALDDSLRQLVGSCDKDCRKIESLLDKFPKACKRHTGQGITLEIPRE
jgi:hypothetical protein